MMGTMAQDAEMRSAEEVIEILSSNTKTYYKRAIVTLVTTVLSIGVMIAIVPPSRGALGVMALLAICGGFYVGDSLCAMYVMAEKMNVINALVKNEELKAELLAAQAFVEDQNETIISLDRLVRSSLEGDAEELAKYERDLKSKTDFKN